MHSFQSILSSKIHFLIVIFRVARNFIKIKELSLSFQWQFLINGLLKVSATKVTKTIFPFRAQKKIWAVSLLKIILGSLFQPAVMLRS